MGYIPDNPPDIRPIIDMKPGDIVVWLKNNIEFTFVSSITYLDDESYSNVLLRGNMGKYINSFYFLTKSEFKEQFNRKI